MRLVKLIKPEYPLHRVVVAIDHQIPQMASRYWLILPRLLFRQRESPLDPSLSSVTVSYRYAKRIETAKAALCGSFGRKRLLNLTVPRRMAARWTHGAPVPTRRPGLLGAWQPRL